MREPSFIMPDKSLIAFSLAPSSWLEEVCSGSLVYLPESDVLQSRAFGVEYASRLLLERGR